MFKKWCLWNKETVTSIYGKSSGRKKVTVIPFIDESLSTFRSTVLNESSITRLKYQDTLRETTCIFLN